MILTIAKAAERARELELEFDRLASAYAELYPNYIHEFLVA